MWSENLKKLTILSCLIFKTTGMFLHIFLRETAAESYTFSFEEALGIFPTVGAEYASHEPVHFWKKRNLQAWTFFFIDLGFERILIAT